MDDVGSFKLLKSDRYASLTVHVSLASGVDEIAG